MAVRIPAGVIAQLISVQAQLKHEFHDVTWTRPEAMHLTLQFLGNVRASELPQLSKVLAATAKVHRSFKLGLVDAGSFGNRVLWVGAGQGATELKSLAEAVRAAAGPFAEHQEEREFNAHVTLGRFRERGCGVDAVLSKMTLAAFTPWHVEGLELIRSELSPKGSRYSTLIEWPLNGAAT